MNIVKSEQVIMVDCDDTLVLHDVDAHPTLPKVLVHDPYAHKSQLVAVHLPHVLLIRERAKRGAHIVVWSAGGWQWAKAVVAALELNDCVASCMSKPIAIIDDLPIKAALGKTLFLNPNSRWKRGACGL